MTQTENLKLNLWVPTDAVNLGQMNDNFQKIDRSSNLDILMDVTTTTAAMQIDLDVSGIDWAKYAYVYLDNDLYSYPGTAYGELRVNGNLNGRRSVITANGLQSSNAGMVELVSTVKKGARHRVQRTKFYPLFSADRPVSCFSMGLVDVMFGCADTSYNKLKTLNLVSRQELYQPSSRFILWGVKS